VNSDEFRRRSRHRPSRPRFENGVSNSLWCRCGGMRISPSRCPPVAAPVWSHCTFYLHWKSRGKPFKLANGMLVYDGISHDSKYRALKDLERRGLITVEWRPKRSPIIHVHE